MTPPTPAQLIAEARVHDCDSSPGLPTCRANWPDAASWCVGCLSQALADALTAAIQERDYITEVNRRNAARCLDYDERLTAALQERDQLSALLAETTPPVDDFRARVVAVVNDYDSAMHRREHAGVAAGRCIDALRCIIANYPDPPSEAVTHAKLVEARVKPGGEIGIDFDYGPRAVVSFSIGERSLGFAALIDGFSASGWKAFDYPLPSNVLDFLRAHLKGDPR